jgi:hypothetical protein
VCRTRSAGTRRTAEYVNWRYAEHPLFAYRMFEARVAGQLAGFAAYRVEKVRDMPVCVGRIVELFGDPEAERALVGALLEDAHSRVVMMDFFCGAAGVAAVMAQHGFVRGDHPAAGPGRPDTRLVCHQG